MWCIYRDRQSTTSSQDGTPPPRQVEPPPQVHTPPQPENTGSPVQQVNQMTKKVVDLITNEFVSMKQKGPSGPTSKVPPKLKRSRTYPGQSTN